MLQITVSDSYTNVDAADWDALVGDANPFIEHAYLVTLETTGCATAETGWLPRPVLVRDAEHRLVGAAPGWLTNHSRGEFVYDHGWADAAHRAGIPYYPKLVVGVPFTPVTGPRLLCHPSADASLVHTALLKGLRAAQADAHGLHVLFNPKEEAAALVEAGLFSRVQFQFHWHNQGFSTFDDWLSTLPGKRRNKIRRERKEVAHLRIEAVTQPSHDLLRAMHKLHSRTCAQFGPWGQVYLSEATFCRLADIWPDRLQLVCAWDGDRLVAGALNVRKGDALFGRYWGSAQDVRFLHFEVCYYKPVELAIANGWQRFEPGHGGEHKYIRGFSATPTMSSHAFTDPRLHAAFESFAVEEAKAVEEHIDSLRQRHVRP